MKKKKFLVLLLTFIMVFALAACGGDKDDDDDDDKSSKKKTEQDDDDDDDDKKSNKDDDEDDDDDDKKSNKDDDDDDDKKASASSIDGTWYYKFDASEMLGEELGIDDISFVMDVYFSFDEDDATMEMYIDEDSFASQMEDIMVDYMYDQFEQMGLSKSDADAACEEEYGDDVKGYVKSMLPELLAEAGDEFSMSGYYKTEGDKLFFAEDEDDFDEDDYILFELKGKKLTLDDPEGSDTIPDTEIPLPLTLEKVK